MAEIYQLRCRECGKLWGNAPKSFCEECFSPLEISYDYGALKGIATQEKLAGRDFNMWRYAEFLPLP
jgi:threonine synthase